MVYATQETKRLRLTRVPRLEYDQVPVIQPVDGGHFIVYLTLETWPSYQQRAMYNARQSVAQVAERLSDGEPVLAVRVPRDVSTPEACGNLPVRALLDFAVGFLCLDPAERIEQRDQSDDPTADPAGDEPDIELTVAQWWSDWQKENAPARVPLHTKRAAF
jgi:hypothetical protein